MFTMKDKRKDSESYLIKPSDVYYECVTACSLNNEDLDCFAECVATYYQKVVEA